MTVAHYSIIEKDVALKMDFWPSAHKKVFLVRHLPFYESAGLLHAEIVSVNKHEL